LQTCVAQQLQAFMCEQCLGFGNAYMNLRIECDIFTFPRSS